MLNQSELIDTVAAYKKDSEKHFWDAVTALLALAWPYRKEGFAFDESFALYDEAIVECINLSDKCSESAKRRLYGIIEDTLDYEDDDTAWNIAEGTSTESFDMAGTHLLDLLGVWISIAAVNKWTQGYTRVMISRYIHNPFLCPEWKNIPLDTLAWGRGYAKDVAEQLAVIGQSIIIGGARYAEWADAQAKGATYYIRRRGSTYDCDICDELAGIIIPIEEPFEIPHPRCVCRPEYHYEPISSL